MIARRHKHDEATRYSIFVLWLMGYTERSIAYILGMRAAQVNGVISKSEYAGRASMTEKQRQERLNELKLIRYSEGTKPLDGGLLDRISFKVQPLAGRQSRRSGRRTS